MKLHILVVSHNREDITIKNMKRCEIGRAHAIKHVETLDDIQCTIWVTSVREKEFFDKQFNNHNWVNTVIVKKYIEQAPILMSNFLQTTKADVFHITWDDHGVYEDCYTNALNAMIQRFPERTIHQLRTSYDGVVGMDIVNYPKHWPWQSGFGPSQLIGSGVLESFKIFTGGLPLFCPDYKRVCWECEFSAYMRFHNSMWYCGTARVDHWRPDVHRKPDKSHTNGRDDGSMNRDRLMYLERRRRGYFWGLNFDLVGDLDKALKLRDEEVNTGPIVSTRCETFKLDNAK